ncbi:MAG: Gfo/Idh/MocA family oxidoreductase [Candidatus Marinimicrobia bacterium]|jgi:UDP-2-acetamido-3-amino-2,3-dideoxy-glucuronate N-acetyltransferase|nr:Gfo/Idh/MocA family oxidoreductase [Candidatus Neomarinimicrobiota bacterium]MBT5269527.1 Gfo/Idh/MocA family oxidoreductase [Candidatus Neomarinimicrobiota bacterium]
MNSNVKICVVGAGRWGTNHIKTLKNLGSLAGIVESREDRRGELKTLFPEATLFHSVRDVPLDDFDGFTVATPAETHFEVGSYLLEHDKHVLIEKPIALNTKEAGALKELADKHKVNLMVGHVLLFHPAIIKIKELIDSGKIGKLEYIYSNRLNLGTVRTEENILWSFAPHDISIFEYFIGSNPVEVVSRGGAFLTPGIHDTTMTSLTYPNNVVGHIFVSWLHPFKEHRMVMIGSKGMISFEDSSEEKDILFYEKGIDWVQGEPIKRDGPTEVIPYDKGFPLTNEIQYFIDHLDGSKLEIADGQNAFDVLEVLEKATHSLQGTKADDNSEIPASESDFFVHPTSEVDAGVTVGKGTKIWHYSHVQGGSSLGENVSIGQNVNVGNNVKIGNSVKIQNNVSVYEGVELEDYVFCGPSMVFTNIQRPRSEFPQRGTEFYAKTLVKKSASIGANATIVCGSTIGEYAFIGAGSVVTKDVPAFALVVGNPGKIIGWVDKKGHRLEFDDSGLSECGEYKFANDFVEYIGK